MLPLSASAVIHWNTAAEYALRSKILAVAAVGIVFYTFFIYICPYIINSSIHLYVVINIEFKIILSRFFEKNENLVFSNLGVMDKTQYFKYNDFPENLEEKQKFLNKVGEKINFVFYQGSFEKNSNIYWIISLDRETFFSEIYFIVYGKKYIMNL